MDITEDMDLDALAERMGDATENEARCMRYLLSRDYPGMDTADITADTWEDLLDAACDPEALLVAILATVCTRDSAGRHFTETVDADALDDLEARGWIEIDRPTHEATGIPYGCEFWSLTVTDAGLAVVEAVR